MAGQLLWCLLVCAIQAGAGVSDINPSSDQERKAQEELHEYARRLGKEWFNQIFHIDPDDIGASLQRRARAYSDINFSWIAPGTKLDAVRRSEPVLYAINLRLEQYDDILRVTRDVWDIPFALKMDAEGRFLRGTVHLQTRIFVPLSWKDELRADARLPLKRDARASWLSGLGPSLGLVLRSAYSNRLGLSSVQAGLEAQWMQLWSLEYDWKARFGQGEGEYTHWLKMEKYF